MSRQVTVEEYLQWLYPQFAGQAESGEYWDLMRLMQAKEFLSFVHLDENRMHDGLDLRAEYCHDHRLRRTALDHLGPCSFLEVLLGLSRRLSFQSSGDAPGWAWQLVQNIELHRMRDPLSQRKANRADEIMDCVIHRKYRPDGGGGFFPLIDTDEDQTQVELWYQMAAYVREIHPGH